MDKLRAYDCAQCAKNTLPDDKRALGWINCNVDYQAEIYWNGLVAYCKSYEERKNGVRLSN